MVVLCLLAQVRGALNRALRGTARATSSFAFA
jgi:hypothetical protein